MVNNVILPFHVLAGILALVFGYVALFAAKGGWLHRRSGRLFAYAMVVMALGGAFLAALSSTTTSVIAGLLTFYFVVTGVLTVTGASRPKWIDRAGVAIALAIGTLAITTGFDIAGERPEAVPMFIFGAMALVGATGDVKMIRAGGIEGKRRIRRHLWRLCFAMWVAAASFFWGPPGRVPEIINIPALLPIPVLAPVVVMIFWLVRLRVKKSFRGIVGVAAPHVSAAVE